MFHSRIGVTGLGIRTRIAPEWDTSMTISIESQRRRLLRHGFIFLFMGAWLGIATAILPHPRAWLAAHLTAFFACLILVAIGLVWRELHLTERQRSIGLIAGFTSAYLGLVGNIFGARLWICRDRRRSRVSRHPCLRRRSF
jgi:hypothetical protein